MKPKAQKIGVVVRGYGRVGGGERFVMALTEQLAKNPLLEMHVFANRWEKVGDAVIFHKVPAANFPRSLTTLGFAWMAHRRIRAAGMDLIHAHDRILHADLFTAHGIPHKEWTRDVRQKRPSLFDRTTAWVEKRLLKSERCRHILPVSTLASERIVRTFPDIVDKVTVVHPGVDIKPFEHLDRKRCRKEIRQKFGFTDSDRLILFVGMNFEVKGLDKIMAAVARLKDQKPDAAVKLLVVGKGNQKKYLQLARQMGISDRIVFASVWTDEIAPVYVASDLFMMLSVYDTFGLTILEAMAAGLPVVISPTVGARDIIRNGRNGFVVDPDDPDEISLRMEASLDPAQNAQMAQSARITARAHTWAAIAEKITVIYGELLGRNLTAGR